MKEKKYIDRLYQEKFRDFEATPRDAVWQSIAAKLKEEEKKPVAVPLWSRLAGVAAILAFLLLIGDWLLPNQALNAVVIEENQIPDSLKLPQEPATQIAVVPPVVEPEAEPVAQTLATNSPDSPAAAERALDPRIAEASAIEITSRNAIFGTYHPLSGGEISGLSKDLPQQKEELFSEFFSEEEPEIAVSEPKNTFEISTHAAPIYYGNMGRGNFIDPRFNNNSSEGEVTYSYGIKIAYHLNDKIKIRSGVNRVNMSYNTAGVAFQAVAGSSPVKNISLQASVPSTVGGKTSGRNPSGNTNKYNVGYIRPGELNQKTGYYEIPVELEYNLFANKFELNLIGGASTLFLAENEVFLNSENVSVEGRANNLNNISFSTNIGLGLDYNLSRKFKLNLEPMLKYQLNTFENSTSDTRPYYFGIYSGFSYKF